MGIGVNATILHHLLLLQLNSIEVGEDFLGKRHWIPQVIVDSLPLTLNIGVIYDEVILLDTILLILVYQAQFFWLFFWLAQAKARHA